MVNPFAPNQIERTRLKAVRRAAQAAISRCSQLNSVGHESARKKAKEITANPPGLDSIHHESVDAYERMITWRIVDAAREAHRDAQERSLADLRRRLASLEALKDQLLNGTITPDAKVRRIWRRGAGVCIADEPSRMDALRRAHPTDTILLTEYPDQTTWLLHEIGRRAEPNYATKHELYGRAAEAGIACNQDGLPALMVAMTNGAIETVMDWVERVERSNV